MSSFGHCHGKLQPDSQIVQNIICAMEITCSSKVLRQLFQHFVWNTCTKQNLRFLSEKNIICKLGQVILFSVFSFLFIPTFFVLLLAFQGFCSQGVLLQ